MLVHYQGTHKLYALAHASIARYVKQDDLGYEWRSADFKQ